MQEIVYDMYEIKTYSLYEYLAYGQCYEIQPWFLSNVESEMLFQLLKLNINSVSGWILNGNAKFWGFVTRLYIFHSNDMLQVFFLTSSRSKLLLFFKIPLRCPELPTDCTVFIVKLNKIFQEKISSLCFAVQ